MSELITDASPSPSGVSDEVSEKKSLPGALVRSVRTGAPVLPFLAYVALGLILPTIAIINLAFRSNAGKLTLANMKVILCTSNSPSCLTYRTGFETSLKLALVTSIVPGILGTLRRLRHRDVQARTLQTSDRRVLGRARPVRRGQLGVHVHRVLQRRRGRGDALAGRHRPQSLEPRLQPLQVLGRGLRLHVLPDTPHDLDHHAGLRRAQSSPGARRPRASARRRGATGDTSACRCWRRPYSVACSCSSAAGSRPTPRPRHSPPAPSPSPPSRSAPSSTATCSPVRPNLAYALGFAMIVILLISVIGYALLRRRTSRWLR